MWVALFSLLAHCIKYQQNLGDLSNNIEEQYWQTFIFEQLVLQMHATTLYFKDIIMFLKRERINNPYE